MVVLPGESVWDQAVTSLATRGVAVVHLDHDDHGHDHKNSAAETTKIHARAFQSARRSLDVVLESPFEDGCINTGKYTPLFIPHNADSAHATGFHGPGGMSQRYNAYREGIVFSDDGLEHLKETWHQLVVDDYATNGMDRGNLVSSSSSSSLSSSSFVCTFPQHMEAMSDSLHGIADNVLMALERRLQMDPGWFQTHLGPFRTSSQWHIKRYTRGRVNNTVHNENDEHEDSEKTSSDEMRNEKILLPMHTDPSLISVVIHDVPGGKDSQGATGLQYCHQSKDQPCWIEVEGHGHTVAIILVGSVLAHLTSNQWPAVKHRVVQPTPSTFSVQPRMAATLFLRPQGSAFLQLPLPSPVLRAKLDEIDAAGGKTKVKPAITFDAWLQRVAKNYEKRKKKQTELGN